MTFYTSVLSLLLTITLAVWSLVLMVLGKAGAAAAATTTTATPVHPAAALLWLGAAVHASVLVQGTRIALPRLLATLQAYNYKHQNDEDNNDDDDDISLQQSHPWAAAIVKKVTTQTTSNNINSCLALASFDAGAQGLIVLLLLSAAPVATDTAGVLGLPSWFVTLTSMLAVCSWWSVALQLATWAANTRSLHVLNTPATMAVWYASRACSGIWYLPQVGLPATWQAVAEKKTKVLLLLHQDKAKQTYQDIFWWYCRVLFSLCVTAWAFVVLALHVGFAVCAMLLATSVVAGMGPSMSLARKQLSSREQ